MFGGKGECGCVLCDWRRVAPARSGLLVYISNHILYIIHEVWIPSPQRIWSMRRKVSKLEDTVLALNCVVLWVTKGSSFWKDYDFPSTGFNHPM